MAAGQAQAGNAGFAFLKIVPGARPSGMSTVGIAVEGDLQSLALNPAGIKLQKDYELTATHVELFEDMRLENLGFAHAFKGGIMAYSLTWINEGTQEGRDANRQLTGNFGNNEYAGGVSYAHGFGAGSLGLTLKGINSHIGQESGTGVAVDVGMQYPVSGFKAGASVLNLGKAPKLGGDGSDLPLTIGAGISRQFWKKLLLTAEIRRNLPENMSSQGAGMEFQLHELIVLRGGYLYTKDNGERGTKAPKGASGGFGLKVGGLTLDYAITSMGELGYVHRATLGLAF